MVLCLPQIREFNWLVKEWRKLLEMMKTCLELILIEPFSPSVLHVI
ncbi:hypothetical protein RchiOBHm_Chr7g0187101 [Rosa chinensis]|uniref:Uncharacterized protein n=1 Tax=Rosa chinensis TaxID=74649 RepID=A0A2P6P434_ROSCH|nr:hypothetical protein RchiOBHm_Chr7g0187101 [Rosa chinensis]